MANPWDSDPIVTPGSEGQPNVNPWEKDPIITPQVKGLLEPGNIDLNARPIVKNPDGTISTVKSKSWNFGGKEVLLPTVSDDGRMLTDQEAIAQYQKTKKHLGIFDNPDDATAYAQKLHEQQAQRYGGGDTPWANDPIVQPAQQAKMGEPGFFQKQVTEPLKQGYTQFRQQMGIANVDLSAQQLRQFDQVDEEIFRHGFASGYQLARSFGDPKVEEYALASRQDQPVPGMREQLQAKKNALRQAAQTSIATGAQTAAEAGKAIQQQPLDPTLQKLYSTSSPMEWAKAIWADPLVITRVGLQSLPQMIPGVVAGAVAGPAGIGMGSTTTDTYASLAQSMQAKGVDMTNPDAIREALVDPSFLKQARRDAQNRGLAVGAFDTATAGLATVSVLPKKLLERGLAGKAAELGAQTGIQMTGGAAGEAVGQQIMPSSGQPTDILLEALGEVPGGAVEAAGIGLAAGKYAKGPDVKAPLREEDFSSLFQGKEAELPPPSTTTMGGMAVGEAAQPATAVTPTVPVEAGIVPTLQATPQVAPQVTTETAATRPIAPTPQIASAVTPEIQASIQAMRSAVTTPLSTIAQRVQQLPPSTGILMQTPGVSGTNEALALARRASRMKDEAARFVEENQPEAAATAQVAAENYMKRAEEKGFTYTPPGEVQRQELAKRGMTTVGAVKSTTPPIGATAVGQQVQAVTNPVRDNLRQQPDFFQNPIGSLQFELSSAERRVPGQVKKIHSKLYTIGEHPSLAKAIRFIRPLASRLMPEMRFVIDTREESPFQIEAASYTGFKEQAGVIHLHPSTLDNESLLTAALTHEMGHALVHYHWGNTPTDQQQAIYAAFGRHLMKVFGPEATARMFLDDLHSPFALATIKRIYDSQLNKGSMEFLKESFYSGWYSFDEWIAEQASKWMFTNARVVTLMDRFFKTIGDAMEKVLKMVGRTLPSFSPEREVKAWLDSMLERRMGGLVPLTASGTLDQYRAGVEENAKALGVLPGMSVVPPQAETIPLRTLALKLPGVFTKKSLAQSDKWSGWIKWTNNLLQQAALNPHIAGLQTYTESTRAWWITKMKITSLAVGRLREWGKLGKENGENLSRFIFDIDSMSYLKQGENPRWPTTPELAAMAKKHFSSVSADQGRAAVDLYFKIKQDFLWVLDQVEAAWVQDAARSFAGDPLRMSTAIAEIHSDVAQLRAKPYFPHERYGKWTVKVKENGKLVHYALAPTEKEAIKLAKTLQQNNPASQVSSGKLPEEMQVFQGLPPSLIRQMATQLERLPGGLSQEQKNAMDELAFAMSPANSFAKKWMRRKGTPGFSMDARRAYASYFLHAGGHIARLQERANMEDGIKAVRDSANAMMGVEAASAAGERMGIADAMKRHLDYIMNPPNEWTGLRGVGFFWYLWGNVSSALMNLVQVPLFTLPYLSARFGDLSSMNELRKSTLDLHKTINLTKSKLPIDETQAIALGVQQEFLDESFATELVSMAQGGVMQRIMPGTQVQRGIMNLMWAGSWLFQKAEQINRRNTFLAAYRLGKMKPDAKHLAELVAVNQRQYKEMLGQGWSPQNAAAWLGAREAVERSQFEYAQFARPEFVRGKKGVIFAFWMWKQNALWFFKNDPGRYRALVTMFALAGLMGLPFAGDLNDLIRYLAALAGKNFNPEQEARKLLAELHVNPDLILHGAGHESFGMHWAGQQVGIPIPNVDVSQRLGMGQLIPGLHEFTSPVGSFAERSGNAMKATLGAIYGIPLTMLKAAESHDPRVWHELQQYLPVAFKNFAKTMDVIEHGGVVTGSGANIAKFDVTDVQSQAELAAMALGFNPTRVAKAWDEKSAIVEAMAYWQGRRGVLFQQFADARFANDREAIADAREAIREFNRTAPDGRLKISVQDLLQSLRSRQKRNAAIERGRAGQSTYEGVAREIRKGYPQ